MDYRGNIIKTLVEKYRNSKKGIGTSKKPQVTRLRPKELYAKYYDNDGDLDILEAINEAAQECQKLGFVTLKSRPLSYELDCIDLIDAELERAEQYLKEQYGYEPRADKISGIQKLLEKYEQTTPAAIRICEILHQDLEQNRLFQKKWEQDGTHIEEVLRALVFIEQNEKRIYIREASMLLYGSSKYLEQVVLADVCKALRDYHEQPRQEKELADEILREYGVEKEPQRICLKGACEIVLKNGKMLSVEAFRQGVEFAAEEMEAVERVVVQAKQFFTIENKTTYYRFLPEESVVFYLGGFSNRFQRDFLKLIYRDNPGLQWYHFGDIDAGGFFIHEHLCRITGIPFKMFSMSKRELMEERYRNCLQPLTVSDRQRLQSLREKEAYRETVDYMLEHGVKLEQEIISYYSMTEFGSENNKNRLTCNSSA